MEEKTTLAPTEELEKQEMPITPCPTCGYPIEVSVQRKGGWEGIDASLILTCTRCDSTWFLKLRDDQVLPAQGALSKPSLSGDIPKGLVQDVLEADKARLVGAHKGAVVLCRRALQLGLEELGAEGRTLGPVREDAERKNLITPRVSILIHGIQDYGDGGAHRHEDFEEAEVFFVISGTVNILNKLPRPLASPEEQDSNEQLPF
ncbi:DUF4145 domain-containing protein [Chloroflexota bacterium]